MTYLQGCPHCVAKRREAASRLSDPTPWNGGGGETSASGPSASPSFHSPMAEEFASLPRSERVEAVLTMAGPSCIGGCGRLVPVHGESCWYCWEAERA